MSQRQAVLNHIAVARHMTPIFLLKFSPIEKAVEFLEAASDEDLAPHRRLSSKRRTHQVSPTQLAI